MGLTQKRLKVFLIVIIIAVVFGVGWLIAKNRSMVGVLPFTGDTSSVDEMQVDIQSGGKTVSVNINDYQATTPWWKSGVTDVLSTEIPDVATLDKIYKNVRESVRNRDYEMFSANASEKTKWFSLNDIPFVNMSITAVNKGAGTGVEGFVNNAPARLL